MNKLMMMAMVAAMGVAGPALATTIGYSGQLRNESGGALTKLNQTITFTLYDKASDGANLWSVRRNVVLDSNGYFNVELEDPDNATEKLADVLKNYSTLYIGLTPDGAAAEIAPRQRILETPRAAVAAVAERADKAEVAAVAEKATAGYDGFTVSGTATIKTLQADTIRQNVKDANNKDAYYDLLPAGVIVMWSGAENEIPKGWHLCDGSTGVKKLSGDAITIPDLRGKFIVGAGVGGSENDPYEVGAHGGSTNLTISADTLPPHQHVYWSAVDPLAFTTPTLYWFDSSTRYLSGNKYNGHTPAEKMSIDGTYAATGKGFLLGGKWIDATHYKIVSHQEDTSAANDEYLWGDEYMKAKMHAAHQYKTSTAGGEKEESELDNRPPYYALCYIIKL